MHRQMIYAVDPSAGTIGNALTGNTRFDPAATGSSGSRLAPAWFSPITPSTAWASYTGYNTSGTSYVQANTVSGDIIVRQSIPTKRIKVSG